MKRIDNDETETYWKIAISGKPGTGKTSIGVSAPDPLILLSERQGLVHVKQAAKRQGKPVPPTLYMERIADYKGVLKALSGPKSEHFTVNDYDTGEETFRGPRGWWPKTVVHDSISDVCEMMLGELKEVAKAEVGRDNLPKNSQRLWGVQLERMVYFIKAFRDLPYHVVFLCLRDEQTKTDSDGNVTERVVQPKMSPRSLVGPLCAAVNVVGYSYRMVHNKQPVYGVVLEAGEEAITKPCAPLRGREVPDLASWVERLSGATQDAPPMPSAPVEVSTEGASADPDAADAADGELDLKLDGTDMKREDGGSKQRAQRKRGEA